MPRIPRGDLCGHVLHILNRGNAKSTVFFSHADFGDFLALLREAKARFPVRVFTFALMPNHFHLTAQSLQPGALHAFMQWWMTSHVRRHHRRHGGSGHVWQGRFKSFPMQNDHHALTVFRYVLRNPVRGGLAASVLEWPYTSLRYPELVDPWPVAPVGNLGDWLEPQEDGLTLHAIRESVQRRRPFGDAAWQESVACDAGLESTLRPLGRPPVERDGT